MSARETVTVWLAWITYSDEVEVYSVEAVKRAASVKADRGFGGACGYRSTMPLDEYERHHSTRQQAIDALIADCQLDVAKAQGQLARANSRLRKAEATP